jgi:hypothetical protein
MGTAKFTLCVPDTPDCGWTRTRRVGVTGAAGPPLAVTVTVAVPPTIGSIWLVARTTQAPGEAGAV